MPQDHHHHGFSPFGGSSRDETPGFHLGDDNVPPSVKAAREEEARKRKEKEAILREIDQERLRQWEQAKREKIEAERKKKEASERLALIEPGRTDDKTKRTPAENLDDAKYGARASSPATQSLDAQAGGTPAAQNAIDDLDDEKYRPRVREIYDPLENVAPCATGSLPLAARANAEEILGSPDASGAGNSLEQQPASGRSHGQPTTLPVAHNRNAQSTTDAPDDLDDEYVAPPRGSYNVKVKPGSPLEGMKRRTPLPPQLSPHHGAGTEVEPKNETPLWQRMSGLNPKQEATMDRNQRRLAIRKLKNEYESRIHASLGEYEREVREAEKKRASGKLSFHEAEGLPASDRSFLWSPLDAICAELSIARRKLSAYMRELTGMSAQEVIDKIKAERVAILLKEKLAAAAKLDYEVRLATAAPEKKEWNIAAGELLKREWEKRRASPGIAWSENHRYAARQQFARELGFSSYNRLYRACLLCFGKTVMELEHAAAVELFAELDKEMAERPEILQAG